MKKVLLILLTFFIGVSHILAADVTEYSESAILVEPTTGKVLYEKDADTRRAPASMTKIMSMILIMDAINNGNLSLDDKVMVSENASSMGGSQVYLNTGESYKVEELLKSIAIASANDAVVAMSEKIAGTEEKFVEMMNNKCQELGCTNTNFSNPHGLDQDNHYSSARDMALMATYLVTKHPEILKYTSIYEDYLQRPDGSNTWLVNTNKLVRFYKDVDGLKTGFTSTAGYCLTSTAKKNNMRLVGVVMGVDSPDNRTSDTVKMLNYGFNTYKLSVVYEKDKVIDEVRIEKSKDETVEIVLMDDATELLNINDATKDYTINIKLDNIKAPIKKGSKIGEAEIIDNNGNVVTKVGITVKKDVLKANLWDYFKRNLDILLSGKKIYK